MELKGLPKCTNACPAGINVKAYIGLISNRDFEKAIEVVRQANPFPAVCGRVCTRPCEESCEQSEKGDPVSIRALKRYASDYELARRPLVSESCEQKYNEKIAIIGSGPAGLSAAVDLIRLGYPVKVFEKNEYPGGMLRYAIPRYRLPDRVLKREIDWIKGLGIKIEINKEIKDFKSLLKKGFSAVLIATGSPKSLPLGIDGEGSDGVIDPLEFLWRIKADKPIDVKGEVVVIGGGSTAFDAARSSIRLGAKKVTLVYRRGYEEMPAEKEEVIDAEEEGVKIITLAIPKKIIVKNKKVQGVEFYKAKLGEPDKSGRRRPIPIKDKVFTVKADILIPAIGAKPDVKNKEIIDNRGRVEVKDYGFTDIKGIFAAGDVETGPSSVVEAIGRGHQAAKGIDSYLRGNSIKEDTAAKVPIVVEKHTYTKSIHSPGKLSKQDRIKSFDEVEKSLNDFEAVEEASRCFTCGPCYLCSICIPNCDHKQLVAKIDNKAFLLKVPSELSQRITKKGTSEHDIKIGKMTEKIKLYSLTPTVNEDLCIGCGRCEEVCSYRAIQNKMIKDEK
ncbi:MAG: FAD-dependent oxidoreductase, partial [Candidatus Heimdallarchaeaceae archaeon]